MAVVDTSSDRDRTHVKAATLHQLPFPESRQLCQLLERKGDRLHTIDDSDCLPGQPLVSLDHESVIGHINLEFTTPLLNQFAPYLWLIATPASSHISSLHDQLVRGRNILITEDPELHLVWFSNRITLKPIPPYLLSYAWWAHYFCSNKGLTAQEVERRSSSYVALLGYLRSYYYLVRHESDFRILTDQHLVPDGITFSDFMLFIACFSNITDHEVSRRYTYGELRLTRLNFWAKPILRRWKFRKAIWQYGDHFARYYAPLLFIFGVLSVVADAMQVGLAARPRWHVYASASAWFSVVLLFVVLVVLLLLASIFALMAGREMIYAIKQQLKGRHGHHGGHQHAPTHGKLPLDEEANGKCSG